MENESDRQSDRQSDNIESMLCSLEDDLMTVISSDCSRRIMVILNQMSLMKILL